MRVFISSTYLDNRRRRKIVEDAVQRAKMAPVGMERFAASAVPIVEDCLRQVRSCDVFVGIVSARYGWIPDGHEISISELEYDAAKAIGLPRLIFEIEADDNGTVASDHPEKLDAFRAKLRADQSPARCPESELGMIVIQSLMSLQREGVGSREAPLSTLWEEIATELYRLRRKACEELDNSAAILANLPLNPSPSELQRREESTRRLREIGSQLRQVGDVPDPLRAQLDEAGVPDSASLRKAGALFIALSNSTTLGNHPTTDDKLAEEGANRAARDEARRLLRCVGA